MRDQERVDLHPALVHPVGPRIPQGLQELKAAREVTHGKLEGTTPYVIVGAHPELLGGSDVGHSRIMADPRARRKHPSRPEREEREERKKREWPGRSTGAAGMACSTVSMTRNTSGGSARDTVRDTVDETPAGAGTSPRGACTPAFLLSGFMA